MKAGSPSRIPGCIDIQAVAPSPRWGEDEQARHAPAWLRMSGGQPHLLMVWGFGGREHPLTPDTPTPPSPSWGRA